MIRTRCSPLSNVPSTWFQVSGNCMAPLIRERDLVMTMPATELRTGDIVVIPGPPPVVHRVIRILKGNYVLTKGDATLRLDSPLAKDELAGKVVAFMRQEGKPIVMKGWLWRVSNYFMARYSLACSLIWELVSKNKWFLQIYRWSSTPLKHVSMSVARVVTGLAILQRG
jgi:hypothetical protein